MACPEYSDEPLGSVADQALLDAFAETPRLRVNMICAVVALIHGYSVSYLRGRASWLGLYETERALDRAHEGE